MPSRAAWVEIDLGAIAHNYKEIRRHMRKDARLCAVVKADAYGHGAIAVARKAIAAGAEYLAVATISEAMQLREAGFTTPLLILGLTKPDSSFDIVDANLTQTVCRLDLVQALSAEAVTQGKKVKVHLAVDTGLGRIGVRPEDAVHFARLVSAMPGIELEGIFSHFALADITDKSYTMEQIRRFQEACASIEAAGIHIPIRHIAESAAILDLPDALSTSRSSRPARPSDTDGILLHSARAASQRSPSAMRTATSARMQTAVWRYAANVRRLRGASAWISA